MLVLIGEMSRGKSVISKELNKIGLKSIVSYTTRPPRLGEVDGIDYHFIDNNDFIRKNNEGFFAETTQYTINTSSGEKIWRYGTSKDSCSQEGVLIINPEGVRTLIASLDKLNEVIVFYITCDEDIARERLKQRGDDPTEVERRISQDKIDFEDIEYVKDFTFINDGSYPSKDIAEMIMIAYKGELEKRKKLIREKNEKNFLDELENHKYLISRSLHIYPKYDFICSSIGLRRYEEAIVGINNLIEDLEVAREEIERLAEIDAYHD
jgi:guanylate kinase